MAHYEATKATLTLATDPIAPPDHTYTTDATLEAVALMAKDSAGFVVIRDELVAWVKSCDAYRGGRGGDRQSWLSLWSGTALKVDRKSAPPLYVPNPRVSVFGGVQPDMLSELATEGMRHDGFLDRILWAWPDPVRDRWTDTNVSSQAKDAVLETFRQLRSGSDPLIVRLSPDAGALFAQWYNDNAERTETAKPMLAGVYAKMSAQAARLALILHCLAHPGDDSADTLSVETLRDALTLTEYFRAQAHRAIGHLNTAHSGRGNDLASRVLRILQEARAATGWVNKSDIHKRLGGHVDASDLDRVLGTLKDSGRAEPRPIEFRAAGRPSESWRAVDDVRTNEINEETPEAA